MKRQITFKFSFKSVDTAKCYARKQKGLFLSETWCILFYSKKSCNTNKLSLSLTANTLK